MNSLKKFNALTLSGGSIRGFAHLGALQYLIEKDLIKNIKYFSGTSIGAMICLLISIGYTGIELMIYICSNDIIEKIRKKAHTIMESFTKRGIYDYSVINDTLSTLVIEKMGYLPTMEDMFLKHGKILIFTTYNLTKQIKEYISYENYPTLSVLDGIRMSCNLPFIFSEFMYNSCDYIDGGLIDNFPLKAFDSVSLLLKKKRKIKKIGINLNLKKLSNISSVADKIYSILFVPIFEREQEKLNRYNHNMIVSIDTDMFGFSFDITNSQKMDLFSIGYTTSKDKIK